MAVEFKNCLKFFILTITILSTSIFTNYFVIEKVKRKLPIIYTNPIAGAEANFSSLRTRSDVELFRDYNRFRRAIFDAFIVLNNEELNDSYKSIYLKYVTEFVSKIKDMKAFRDINAPIYVELNQIINMTENITSLKVNSLLVVLGKMFQKVKTKFEKEFNRSISNCYLDLNSAKRKILEDLERVQRGNDCEKSKSFYHAQKDPGAAGMGSTLHRLALCLSIALNTNTPCVIDDSSFRYGSGELKKIYHGVETCPQILKRSRIEFSLDSPEMRQPKFAKVSPPGVPAKYVSGVDHCHEDISAWYIGVILKFLMEPTNHLKTELEQFEIKYLVNKLKPNFFGVHIRSTDKARQIGRKRTPEEFIRVVSNWVHFSNTSFHDLWVASDDFNYYKSMVRIFSKSSLNSLEQDGNMKARYKTKSLYNFLFDLYALEKSSMIFGAYSSNMLRTLYQLRSVKDIFPSDNLISIDMNYFFSPSIHYRETYKTNSEYFYFNERPTVLEEKSTSEKKNNCFSSNEDKLNSSKSVSVNLTINFREPTDGFHEFKYFVKQKNNSKVLTRSCFSPLFALDKIQPLI